MNNDDPFVQAVAKTEAAGKSRYGDERWNACVDAIGRNGGVSEVQMRELVQMPDPAGFVYQLGKESLLRLSDAGDHSAEATYRELREQERQSHRKMRGR